MPTLNGAFAEALALSTQLGALLKGRRGGRSEAYECPQRNENEVVVCEVDAHRFVPRERGAFAWAATSRSTAWCGARRAVDQRYAERM